MKNEVNQTTTAYSLRSQRAMIEEDRLRGNLEKIDGLIRHAEMKIAELERDKARTLAQIPTENVNQTFLSFTLEALEDNHRKLAAYKEERASAEKTIAQLAPSPAALAARTKEQQQLAQLAAERLEKDREVNDAVASLRQVLKARAALTSKMRESAASLDFTSNDEFLDAQPFDELLASLPEDLLARSQDRAAWFLGKHKDMKPYIVRVRLLVIPETLVSHGVYHFGDRIELSDKEARGLMRKDRPAPTRDARWRCTPPSVVTVEAWDTGTALAAKRGSTIQEFLLWDDWERDAKNKKRFEDTLGASVPLTTEMSIPLTEDHGDLVTVKVKAKRKICFNGREYTDGDIFDFRAPDWNICGMFLDGTIARP